jgi:opacity protein-like surface antigen
MKKIIFTAFALSLFTLGAYAQVPKANISGGYSALHLNGSGGASGINLNGFNAAAGFNANRWLGLEADFGLYHGSPSGVGLTAMSYTFGPRFSFRATGMFVPYVQALVGGSHFSAAGVTSNPFAYAFGGGTQISIAGDGKIALQPEFEYMGFRSNGSTENSERFSVALVYHIGGK